MLDMRWKALERAMNLSQVSAQGDAVFLAFSCRENPTEPYLGSKINRVAGRVIVNACGSVTTEVPMMRIPTYRANGSDREEWELCEGTGGIRSKQNQLAADRKAP